MVRTFPAAGPQAFESTIAEQVFGPGKSSLTARTHQTYDRMIESAPDAMSAGERGWAAGYRIDARGESPSTADVDVLLSQPDGLTEYPVQLIWLHGDWKLRVPATGSWIVRSVATRRAVDYHSYDRLGVGPGGAT